MRRFPSFIDAAGHALLALFNPDNPFTRRYNPGTPEGDVVDRAGWVSGSCFLARRSALEELGGFDEAYFMYAEDMDLCWRAHQAGWGVGFAGTAARHPRPGREHGPPPLPHDGGPPPLGPALHRPDHHGLAPGRPAPGRRWCSGVRMAMATAPPRRHPLSRCVDTAAWLDRRRGGHRASPCSPLVLAAALSGPAPPAVHVEPEVNFALPPASAGCGGATALPGGATDRCR